MERRFNVQLTRASIAIQFGLTVGAIGVPLTIFGPTVAPWVRPLGFVYCLMGFGMIIFGGRLLHRLERTVMP